MSKTKQISIWDDFSRVAIADCDLDEKPQLYVMAMIRIYRVLRTPYRRADASPVESDAGVSVSDQMPVGAAECGKICRST